MTNCRSLLALCLVSSLAMPGTAAFAGPAHHPEGEAAAQTTQLAQAPPPGAVPPGAFPPGGFPPGAFPPGGVPPGAFPLGHPPPGFPPPGHPGPFPFPLIHHGQPFVVSPDRFHQFGGVFVVRPHGPFIPGYGFYYTDHEAARWLAFTAITLGVLDRLNEAQIRAHEAAQIRATTAAVGETITWQEGGASGAVAVVRDGTSTSGRYCREFQHTVIIGGQSEQAYGTACQQPDGTWEIVSTRN